MSLFPGQCGWFKDCLFIPISCFWDTLLAGGIAGYFHKKSQTLSCTFATRFYFKTSLVYKVIGLTDFHVDSSVVPLESST